MKYLRKFTYALVEVIASFVVLGSFLSLLTNTESRYLKMLDFPRIQFFIAAIVCLILCWLLTKKWQKHDTVIAVFLAVSIIIQSTYLINYTPLVSREVPDSSAQPKEEDLFSLLITNVKMSNRNAQPLLDIIEKKDPDILLTMEVDKWWDNALKTIEKKYPFTKESINEVTYGMTLYSKMELKNIEELNLNHEKIPTFLCTVTLANGKDIQLMTLHPPPPTYFQELPDNESKEEKTMILAGQKVVETKLPIVLAGDFNDVAWSKTNEMTKANGELNDVRVGRGFYNSFHADIFLMRWPLDHVFVTKEFKLHKLERLPKIDSDHFPIYVELELKN